MLMHMISNSSLLVKLMRKEVRDRLIERNSINLKELKNNQNNPNRNLVHA